VAAAAVPAEPTAALDTSADIGIQSDDEVEILLETTNFPVANGTVRVRVSQKVGGTQWINASLDPADPRGNSNARASWKAKTKFVPGFTTLQARATVN
jgi:hypothetical protein